MKSLTNEEYWALCEQLVDKQYDTATDNYDVKEMKWIPAEPEAKLKIKQASTAGMIDLTNVHSSKIKEEILKCTNLKVGDFKIKTSKYSMRSLEDLYAIEVWENRRKTPSGMDCNIDYPMDFNRDSRFKNRPWLTYFQNGRSAYKVPLDTLVEIVRWMQAVKKMAAFL